MLDKGIIRSSTSQWNASILVVLKKRDASGKQKLRIILDFRRLNDLMIGNSYRLSNILDQLGNVKYFSILDLASGYHQIAMNEKNKNKTAFSIPYGHYEFNRMPFGLKNGDFPMIDERHIMALTDLRDARYPVSIAYPE